MIRAPIMMPIFIRKVATSCSIANFRVLSKFKGYCSIVSPLMNKNDETTDQWLSASKRDACRVNNHHKGLYSSSSFWQDLTHLDSCEIKVVDSDTWRVSSGLANVSKGVEYHSELNPFAIEEKLGDGAVDNPKQTGDDPDVNEIEDMREHGNLFYKMDRSSLEFEEYTFDLHGRKSSLGKNDKRDNKRKEKPSCDSAPKDQNSLKGKEGQQAIKKNTSLNDNIFVNEERLTRAIKERYIVCSPDDINSSCGEKKRRNPTFNQLTGPYHEPFCLDIYVSKGSVRACVVHRATSKVVAVAHSISKDMKFDVGSPKSVTAAAAVGKFLAQRALADDIHDVIFMPRKGDKLEGKLQIVLQSIIDNGVNVKVKLKQRNPKKAVVKTPLR